MNYNDLIYEAKQCAEANQVLLDLSEETGIKYFRKKTFKKYIKHANTRSGIESYVWSVAQDKNSLSGIPALGEYPMSSSGKNNCHKSWGYSKI